MYDNVWASLTPSWAKTFHYAMINRCDIKTMPYDVVIVRPEHSRHSRQATSLQIEGTYGSDPSTPYQEAISFALSCLGHDNIAA
jgi:hypothetical protein